MELNQQQQAAVNSTAATILCLAGPGSGKTRVLIERISRLIRDGTEPGEIVAITFTNAAAAVMQERLGAGVQLGFCGTLHSFMLRLLREHGASLGFGPGLGVLDEQQAAKLRDQCVTEAKLVATKADIDAEVLRYPTRPKGGNMSQAVLAAARFCQTLREANLVTFDTLLAYGLRLLQEQPECTAQFRHLLWDEFQDSSDMDAELFLALTIPNKFVVGDQDQSIYGFRGGNVGNILALSNRPRTEKIYLQDNYRCASRICDAANALIDHNEDRIPKQTRSATGEAGVCNVTSHATEQAELDWLCAGVRSEGPLDCAVLVRTNALVARFSQGLRGAGIPVAEAVRPRVPQDWSKAKLLIQLLNDPENDTLAYWWIEQTQGAAAAIQARLIAQAKCRSINQQTLKLQTGLPVAAVGESLARAGIGVESIARVAAAQGRLRSDASMADLVLALAAEEQESVTVGEGVTISTIHSAKGKEWGTVFLPAWEDEILPGISKSMDLEESRRLAFVAITRARHTLLISHAAARMPAFASTRAKPATASRFISEAGL